MECYCQSYRALRPPARCSPGRPPASPTCPPAPPPAVGCPGPPPLSRPECRPVTPQPRTEEMSATKPEIESHVKFCLPGCKCHRTNTSSLLSASVWWNSSEICDHFTTWLCTSVCHPDTVTWSLSSSDIHMTLMADINTFREKHIPLLCTYTAITVKCVDLIVSCDLRVSPSCLECDRPSTTSYH